MDFGSIHAEKELGLKTTLKIALKISKEGHNLRFNFFEFIIIFLETLMLAKFLCCYFHKGFSGAPSFL
jgi:hypothetical protein